MNWLTYSLISLTLLSISNVLQRVLMKDDKSDAYAYSFVFQMLAAFIIFLFSLIEGFRLPPVAVQPFNYMLMGVLYGLGTVFIFQALRHLESAEVTIITAVRAFVTIVAAVFFLREPFTLVNLAGALLIFSAVVLVTFKKEKFKFNTGVWYSLGMALCYGLAVVNDRFLLTSAVDTVSYVSISFLFPGLFIFAIKPNVLKKLDTFFQPKVFKPMLIMSLLYSLAAISYFTAFAKGATASQAAPIQQSSVILTVLLAAVFLGERGGLAKKLVGAVLVFIGVLLLA